MRTTLNDVLADRPFYDKVMKEQSKFFDMQDMGSFRWGRKEMAIIDHPNASQRLFRNVDNLADVTVEIKARERKSK